MEYETINKETPEMKQLISGIREVSKRIREIAQTHRLLFGGEIYLTGREVCEHLAGLSGQGFYSLHPDCGENSLSTL